MATLNGLQSTYNNGFEQIITQHENFQKLSLDFVKKIKMNLLMLQLQSEHQFNILPEGKNLC